MDSQPTATSSYTHRAPEREARDTSRPGRWRLRRGAIDYWALATALFAGHLWTTVLVPGVVFQQSLPAASALAISATSGLWSAVRFLQLRATGVAGAASPHRGSAIPPQDRIVVALLFLVFPLCIGVGASELGSNQPDLVAQTLLSLSGYLTCLTGTINAAQVLEENARAIKAHHRLVMPLDEGVDPAAPIRHRGTRRAYLLVAAVGAIALATAAPLLGGLAFFEKAHGDAAQSAQMVTGVVAGCLGVAVMAYFVGPALRASRAPTPKLHARRARTYMSLAALGVLALALLAWYR